MPHTAKHNRRTGDKKPRPTEAFRILSPTAASPPPGGSCIRLPTVSTTASLLWGRVNFGVGFWPELWLTRRFAQLTLCARSCRASMPDTNRRAGCLGETCARHVNEALGCLIRCRHQAFGTRTGDGPPHDWAGSPVSRRAPGPTPTCPMRTGRLLPAPAPGPETPPNRCTNARAVHATRPRTTASSGNATGSHAG